MGKSCCVTDCKNRFNKESDLSFYRLPKAKEKRSKWIAAIRRNNWNPGSETWICSCHFVSGKKSDDPLHPDYVPSLFSFTSKTDRTRAVKNLERYQRFREVSVKRFVSANTSKELAATALMNLYQSSTLKKEVQMVEIQGTEVQTVEVQGTEVQTDETHSDIASLHEQIKSLNSECQSLREKVHELESELKLHVLDPSQFDDSKIKFFTGLPSLQTFMLLFSSVSSVVPVTTKHSLKPTQELLLTLMKLRLNLSEEFLGHLFRIHQSTVSRILRRWIHVRGAFNSLK
ncbi:THAP domain-containing protein 1-like isoform X3 [Megalobrama amblycephala]|uniref:THAP domain-containing protein 1-like isoform X2 n=1 Tax=Megalobrama amblycephala TaxID=75352 RepID=UPI0020142D21|nr:THAP domain-containing protein 1-like isoform X2 [Megalobrama amblycephala]XP_048029373.1 THAP domain-containing protein 1-like isoform X3 [Megalobrama amblycephala]